MCCAGRAGGVSRWEQGCAARLSWWDSLSSQLCAAAHNQCLGALESISEWFPAIVPIWFCLNFSSKTISLVIVLRFRKLALLET